MGAWSLPMPKVSGKQTAFETKNLYMAACAQQTAGGSLLEKRGWKG
jgi:hypothetical protein